LLQTHATSYNFCEGEGEKIDRKPCHLPYGLRNPYRTSSLRTLKIMPRNLNEIVFLNSASGLSTTALDSETKEIYNINTTKISTRP
jgi:hypothetical protein